MLWFSDVRNASVACTENFLPLANATRTSVQARALFDTRLWVSLALLMGTNILLYCELALDRWNSLLVWTFLSEWVDVVRFAFIVLSV